MKKVNVIGLSAQSLSDLVDNSKTVFNRDLGLDLSLNQVRSNVAKQFGAKTWASLQAAVNATSAGLLYVGNRHQGASVDTYYGSTEMDVYDQMANSFCMDFFGERQEEFRLEDAFDVEEFLFDMGIDDIDRKNDLFVQMMSYEEAERVNMDMSFLFTSKEIVRAYAAFWDEETISVEQVSVDTPSHEVSGLESISETARIIHYNLEKEVAVMIIDGALKAYECLGAGKSGFALAAINWDRQYFEPLDFVSKEALEYAKEYMGYDNIDC